MTTYSFKDSSGAFSHPLAGAFLFQGQKGMNQMVVINTVERTEHNVAADGAVMVSYRAGDNGQINIECQQTSDFHAFMVAWFNLCKTAADNGDVSQWARASITIVNPVSRSMHVATGVSPAKVPDKPYAAQGQTVTWTLMAADIQHLDLGNAA